MKVKRKERIFGNSSGCYDPRRNSVKKPQPSVAGARGVRKACAMFGLEFGAPGWDAAPQTGIFFRTLPVLSGLLFYAKTYETMATARSPRRTLEAALASA